MAIQKCKLYPTRRVQCSPTTKRVKLTVQSIKQHVCLTNNISYKLEDQFKSASCNQQKECNFHQQQKQQNLDRYSRLGSPIEFKHLVILNLIVIGKDNNIYVLLVNATKCSNSIGEPNVLHLKYCI